MDIAAKFSTIQAGATYQRYVAALREQSALKESEERLAVQVTGLEQLVTSLAIALPGAVSQPAYQQLCKEVAERRERLKRVVSNIGKTLLL